MKAEEFRKLIEEDTRLRVGERCRVRWTNCYRSYESPAEIVKLNRRTVVVELLEPVRLFGTVHYSTTHKIKVPRITDLKHWTVNNCILRS